MGTAGAGAQSPWGSGSAEGAGAPMGAVHTHQELPAVPLGARGCPVGLCCAACGLFLRGHGRSRAREAQLGASSKPNPGRAQQQNPSWAC